MTYPFFKPAQWVSDNLDRLFIFDGTYHLPNAGRNAYEEYLLRHIPRAQFFDIDKIADTSSPFPHMRPPKALFESALSDFGVHQKDTVIVYDTYGLFSAPRVWWTFKTFGHENVYILEGGLPEWERLGLPLASGKETDFPKSVYTATDNGGVIDMADLHMVSAANSHIILDARPKDRFEMRVPEPRPNVRMGQIPNSQNLPWQDVCENGTLKNKETLKSLFAERGIPLDKPFITSCGSGVTATTLLLALHALGINNVTVYDGSWAEWGLDT